MKRSFGLAVAVVGMIVVAAAPVAAQHDLAGALMTIEKSLWQGWADADGAPFEAHLTDGAVNITPGGLTAGKAALIGDITDGSCEVRSWELSSPAVHAVTDDVAIVTYQADQEATCDGHDVSGKLIVSAVYVNQGGEWKAASYQETPDMSGMMEEEPAE